MTSSTIGNSAIDYAILSVVREAIADEAEVQFVAKLLRQVFVDGKAVADVTEGRCVSADRIEAFVYEIEQVLATTAVDVKQEIDVVEEVDEPTSEMDLPPQSDDELSLELGLEDTDTTTGSSAAKHSQSNDRLQQKPQSFGKAVFTPDGCIVVESKRYPAVTLQFRAFESRRGRKSTLGASYHCSACVGIKCTPIFVADGEIVGRDPDCVGTVYDHLCQKPELAAQFKKKFAVRRLSERKRSAPARLHDVPKPDSTEGQDNAFTAAAPPKDSTSSKPSGPPRKRRRETSTKAVNDENQATSGDETPRLPVRYRPVLQLKNGSAPGQPSNNARYIRQVKAEAAEMKDVGEKAQEPGQVTTPPVEKEGSQPVAPKEDMGGLAAATSKATAYAASFGMAVKTVDPSVVLYENIFGETYTFKLVQEKQVTKDGVAQTVGTYRCQGCMDVKAREQIKGDVPLVKTVDGVFVERDPDHPLGNQHLCIT
ncbi:hypothetical protein AAVH_28190 [Aphelenchoides avenae]|nr:hypothetical protein AAVH_28190 [Aphelenchus avenae]